MVGVIWYAGECRVCQHPEALKMTAALRAHARPLGLSWEYEGEGLLYRDFQQHQRQCIATEESREKGDR